MPRDGAAAARVAHNHEVAGSSPAPATKVKTHRKVGFYLGRKRARSCDLARSEVKTASGSLQENLHLVTCCQSRSSGPAECGRVLYRDTSTERWVFTLFHGSRALSCDAKEVARFV